MRSIDEDILQMESSAQKRRISHQKLAIIFLMFLSTGLLASTIYLGVINDRQLQQCRNSVSSDGRASVAANTTLPEAPPMAAKSTGFIGVPVVTRSSAPFAAANNSTQASPEAKQCEPGSIWGGEMLDGLNHGYMPLMQKALSVSPSGVSGEIYDYYHTALASVFRCGKPMNMGELQLVVACKSAYVIDGEQVDCDGHGAYGNATSAST